MNSVVVPVLAEKIECLSCKLNDAYKIIDEKQQKQLELGKAAINCLDALVAEGLIDVEHIEVAKARLRQLMYE